MDIISHLQNYDNEWNKLLVAEQDKRLELEKSVEKLKTELTEASRIVLVINDLRLKILALESRLKKVNTPLFGAKLPGNETSVSTYLERFETWAARPLDFISGYEWKNGILNELTVVDGRLTYTEINNYRFNRTFARRVIAPENAGFVLVGSWKEVEEGFPAATVQILDM